MKKNNTKRQLDAVVISDVHLGTYGCHAKEVLRYLKSIETKKLILNGDIVDMWQFSTRYFPTSHMKVIKYILNLVSKETKVYYITGNHDETLRKFAGYKMGSLKIINKMVLQHNGKRSWIFHGDVFDVTMKHSKWLAKLGAKGYDTLILINRFVNYFSEKMGYGKISLSQKVKNSVKKAMSYIEHFEETAADIAISNKYDYVICGHIHHPVKRIIKNDEGQVVYLNSGDWIENLSALELKDGDWSIYNYKDEDYSDNKITVDKETNITNNKELFKDLVGEFLTIANKN